MGYYTMVEVELKVKKERLSEFKKEWERTVALSESEDSESKSEKQQVEWIMYYNDLKVDTDDCYIGFEEYYRKWYYAEEFYNFIKDYVEKGCIQGQGEEFKDLWRVTFDGNGNWREEEAFFLSGILGWNDSGDSMTLEI